MTRTQEMNAVRVYEAVQRVALAKVGIWHRYFTIGEVAIACGMSKPTVSKYIPLMLEIEVIEEIDSENRKERCVRQFKYTEAV